MKPTDKTKNAQEVSSPDYFAYSTTPKNNWELLWWAFSDEDRVGKYTESLNLTFWQERRLFLRVFFFNLVPVVLAIILPLWVLGMLLMVGVDLTVSFPIGVGEQKTTMIWQTKNVFLEKFTYLLVYRVVYWFFGLIGGLFFGLLFGLVGGLVYGLVGGLVGGLLGGLVGSLLGGLVMSLVGSLFFGLLFGLFFGLFGGLGVGLVVGLVGGLGLSLVVGLVEGSGINLGISLGISLGVSLGVSCAYIYFALQCINSTLYKNIYIKWGKLNSSFFAERRFIHQTQENPVLALQFVEFLFKNRKRNRNLAELLAQVATATLWKNVSTSLEADTLIFSGYKTIHFKIPEIWRAQIKVVHKSLVSAELETQISLKKELFEVFVEELERMYHFIRSPFPYPKDFLGQSSVSRNIDWYKYYREAIEAWQEVARQKLHEIVEQASLTEPITPNFYKSGDTLTVLDESVFMERRDLRDKLSRQLHTTKGFSVLYLQGQRRVGKTSLVSFFPQILGSRFEIIYFNTEGNIKSVPDFLQKLHEAFVTKTQTKETTWQQPAHWADALRDFIGRVGDYAKQKGKRVILAIDEFEYLHPFLQADEPQGKEFLGAFRAMLGSQADVSLMWIGLHFFSELTAPSWNEFFVNTIRIEVPYLTREESYQLIEVAQLAYPNAVKEEIYRLTQGQPALIQKICFAIVDIANRDGRRAMTEADLQEALKRMIYIQDNNVTDVFWTQICEKDEQGRELDKAIVWAVREGKPIPRTVRHRLRRLEEYGFVVQAGEGYKIRVPIFEYWIDNFTQYFDLSKMEV